ncbi:putative Ubiquitin, Ubiquitin subgroup protein [Trachipleistophora hominis]|uniref:Putative Ubiquitin, Ubiquitin subgroup protein n=1 Tax=Trachipleistophora hominis TaxID=72359 RepID=L7JRG0_TRAHO|nr:putative Ubiquitin, Ubiquitin subgroup protein [Trachipleistophora hominis]
MHIKIKSLIGVEKQIEIEEKATVLSLKQQIEMLETIPPEQQRLIYSGKILTDDGKILSDYNVNDGCVVQMVLALRGG